MIGDFPPMPLVLRNYQEDIKAKVYSSWNEGNKNVLLVMATGLGKCLAKGTKVLLYDGSIKPVEEISTNDLLMGPDSKPRKVLSTCNGTSDMFKINPVKGESWVCNDVHVLTLRHTETKKIIDIPLNDYLKTNKNFKRLYKQFRVGVDFESSLVSFDPYLAGIYLAEGTYGRPHISNPDKEILNYINSWCKKNEMKASVIEKNNHFEIGIADINQGWRKNKLTNFAKRCTNKSDRWIPREFLVNSRNVRLKVLAGLLDGDGYLKDNVFEITTKYDSLNRDILFLARSLGFAAYSKKKISRIKSLGFEGEYHRITISGNTDEIPTLVKRKRAKPRKQRKDVLGTGFSVEPLGKGEYFGFELDGDGRFLLGDFTVTHNTKTFSSIAIDKAILPEAHERLPTAIMVHRKELVQQISLTLAEEGITHNIIAPRPVILGIVAAQRQLFKTQFYDYNALITVISVDTLNSRIVQHEKWAKSIKLWITDEAAHLLKNNKWGKAIDYFPNAIGLGVTATPQRLDKRGLGRHADGVFDTMIEGPGSKWGIENGFLSKYKIAIPQSDYERYLRKASEGSDYSKEAMVNASRESHIVGDVVENYKKFANGKQAILFATDIDTAGKMERQFIGSGVSAKLLTGLTDDKERLQALIDFREKKIQVLLNVDLFDEGLDVPGIECVIMARPTMSLAKFLQMVGRGLRIMQGKPYMILIDHVGNVKRHGLPCTPRSWTLDRIVKRRDKVNLIRICSNPDCNAPYDRTLTECPWCGTEALVSSRDSDGSGRTPPEMVDGDLELIDPETIRELEKNSVLESPMETAERVFKATGSKPASIKAMKDREQRIETQTQLSHVIAQWAGIQKLRGYSDRQIHKRFYLERDMTITQALSLPKAEMLEIMGAIKWELRI